MTPELKLKLILWEIRSNQKTTVRALFNELRYEMQLETDSFIEYIDWLQALGHLKVINVTEKTLGNVVLTPEGDKHLSFSEEERLDIILNYCKDVVSTGQYNNRMWNKIADRSSEGNNPNFRERVEYLEKRELITRRDPIGYVATPEGLMFEGFVAQKEKGHQEKKNNNIVEVGGAVANILCPFTGLLVECKIENGISEYTLSYNNHSYRIKIKDIKLVEDNILKESSKWVFQGMLFNNEWPIEPETIVTPQLILQITRLADHPRTFQEKTNYFLLKCYSDGGSEFKRVEYNYSNYQIAYAEDQNEFSRIITGLVTVKFIKTIIDNKSKEYLTFERDGIEAGMKLLQTRKNLIPDPNAGLNIKVLIVTTVEDSPYEKQLTEFLGRKFGFLCRTGSNLKGTPDESIGNLENTIEGQETDYVVFVKSHFSEKNTSFIRIEASAMREHRKTEKQKYAFLFFAGIEDGPYNFPMTYFNYHNCFYDFRIISNRNRLGNHILQDYNKRQLDLVAKPNNTEILAGGRSFNFPKVSLSKDDEFWLKKVLSNFLSGNEPYYSEFLLEYLGKEVEANYDPTKIKPYLLSQGSEITYYGIWAVDPTSKYLEMTEQLITTIRDILIRPGSKKDKVTYEMITNEVELELEDGYKCLKLLDRIGGFMNGWGHSPKSFSITIQGNEKIQREYFNFISLENTLRQRYPELDKNTADLAKAKLVNSEMDFKQIHAGRTYINITDKNEISPVLGVIDLSQDIASIICRLKNEKGQMIGIFGKWGRGKTYFLDKLIAALSKEEQNPKYTTITYHAWKYQETPASWAYLYEQLSEHYLGDTSFIGKKYKTLRLNYKRKGILPIASLVFIFIATVLAPFFIRQLFSPNHDTVIGFITIYSAFLAIGGTLYKQINDKLKLKANNLIRMYSKKHSFKDSLGIQADIQNEIITLLKTWIPDSDIDKRKILLVVEDIDRCTEERIIQNIDSLRIMLEDEEIAKRLIIVTAIDETILKNAIHLKYSRLLSNKNRQNGEPVGENYNFKSLVVEYLDKIFILAIKLGELVSTQRREFLVELIKKDIGDKVLDNIEAAKKERKITDKMGDALPAQVKKNMLNDPGFIEGQLNLETMNSILSERGRLYDISLKTDDIKPLDGDVAIEDEKGNITSYPNIEKEVEERKKGQDILKTLTVEEVENLEHIINIWESATPRKIRIFYYRFLLCKHLLMGKYKNNRVNIWQNMPALYVFMFLIYNYAINHNIEEISKKKNEILFSSDTDFTITTDISEITVYKEDYLYLLEILELIIAY